MGPALRLALEKAGIADFTKSSAAVKRALDKVLEDDPALRADCERDIEIRKALSRPYADFGGLGGTRHMSVPLFEAGASDADADVERVTAALGVLSGKVLGMSRAAIESAARDPDFRRGRASRGSGGRFTKQRFAADLEEIVRALNSTPDY